MNIRSISVALCVTAAVSFSGPSASAWEPDGGATFNNPAGTHAEQWRIIDSVDSAVRNARRGSTILISTFLMNSPTSTKALIGAHRRGVHVQIVMDGAHAKNDESRRIARILNRDNGLVRGQWGPDKSFAVFCQGGCRGSWRGINHSKFYVFTKTGTAENVVMVSSSNLNTNAALLGWNDLYTVKERPRMVRNFADVHREMALDIGPGAGRYLEFVDGPFAYRFFPMPSGQDPVFEDLSKVECRGARGGSGRNGRTVINISMFAWSDDRGVRLAQRVVELDSLGCDVSVIHGVMGWQVREILKGSARHGGIELFNSRFDRDRDGGMDFRTHEKYMLISGVYAGDRSAWRVHTGSQNWTSVSLTGSDEATLNITGRAAYVEYKRNWDYIRSRWTTRVG